MLNDQKLNEYYAAFKLMVNENLTLRQTAVATGLSKSSLAAFANGKGGYAQYGGLEKRNKPLYDKVRVLLDKNKQERSLRGGHATAMKYFNQNK